MKEQMTFLLKGEVIRLENKLADLRKFLQGLEKGGWRDYCVGRFGRYDEETFKMARRRILHDIIDIDCELAAARSELSEMHMEVK